MLAEKDSILESIFDFDKREAVYTIQPEYREDTEQLKDAAVKSMKEILDSGSCTLIDGYVKVREKCEKFGTMEWAEFKEFVKGIALEDGKGVSSVFCGTGKRR